MLILMSCPETDIAKTPIDKFCIAETSRWWTYSDTGEPQEASNHRDKQCMKAVRARLG